jgi:hypothetical protein
VISRRRRLLIPAPATEPEEPSEDMHDEKHDQLGDAREDEQ